MTTTEKLKVAKEILATSFINATEKSIASGLQYAYKSYPVEEEEFKGWVIDILVKESGYGERTIQQFKYQRPNNIDAKNMEYHVIVDVIGALTQGALISWYELAKYLASDTELQKEIIDEAKKVISLPTNEGKIYRQILAFMNFMLNLTPQERDVLAEVIKLDNEYEALPPEKRGKFILSTDMRKEIREGLNIEEKQFNVILSRLKSPKKSFMGKALIDDNNIIHPELKFKPDQDGFKFEVNFVMTTVSTPVPAKQFTEELEEEIITQRQEEANFVEEQLWTPTTEPITIPTEYKYDASKAPILEEEEFNISIAPPNE